MSITLRIGLENKLEITYLLQKKIDKVINFGLQT